ncbi:MAG: ribonuclease P protein component [Bacteroidia bacterium]|nr:ribonuclease P protein component [Bacteroidia bacterium]MCX7652637.1 ribonuclease P protein component [Bacteroidia bacterium]MDW8417010.1 ribonuclease P protein component [Bacteroidia bacterium]
MSAHRLPRSERLRGRKAFQLLFHSSHRWNYGYLHLYALPFLIRVEGPPLRVAFSIPKKLVRKASRRNFIRRRLREAYRAEKSYFLERLPVGQAWLYWQWRDRNPPPIASLRLYMRALYENFIHLCSATFSSD